MGLSGLEPLTPALSERCSNQLSYRPLFIEMLGDMLGEGDLAKVDLFRDRFTP